MRVVRQCPNPGCSEFQGKIEIRVLASDTELHCPRCYARLERPANAVDVPAKPKRIE